VWPEGVYSKWCTFQSCFFSEGLLAICPTPNLEAHPLSVVRDSLFNIFTVPSICMSQGSSVSLVSDCGLDDRVSIPGRFKGFSPSLCVQTGSGAHPASKSMGTGGSFLGGKARPGRAADYSLHLVPRSITSRSYTSSPPKRLSGV
jgi:hypothetical protein